MNLKPPRAINAICWTSTGLFALFMLFCAYMYFTVAEVKTAIAHFGYPDYFRVELAVAKALGALALLTPVPNWLKEWAYAGFVINLVSAALAHGVVDGPATAWGPLGFLAILLLSRVYWGKRHANLQR